MTNFIEARLGAGNPRFDGVYVRRRVSVQP